MPPKKQKQTPKNGFYYFMLDFKNGQGRNFKSMTEVAEVAGEHWRRMSKEQRKPYEEKALFEKNRMKPGKYTSDGQDVSMIEQRDREQELKQEEMKNTITEEIKLAANNGTIQEKMFFFIHVNCFCFCDSEKRYYPAEIAIAAFNLLDGVLPENVFHSLINPGVLPLGYAGDALRLANETHQIPPPMNEEVENNVESVFIKMKQFLQSRIPGSKRIPILYCNERYINVVEDVLNTWCDDYNDPTSFSVYNLQYMFRVLRNTVAGGNVWPTDGVAVREIEKDVNAYAKGISCDYHETSNVPVHCSRSIVVRSAYTVCDNCCPDLNIPFVPGCHVPLGAAVVSSRPSSVASTRSSKSKSSRSSSYRDDDSESVISVSSKSEWDNVSVSSAISTINDDEEFPSLGGRGRKNPSRNSSSNSWCFVPNDTSSQSSGKSYAGAMGTSGLSSRPSDMPSSLVSGFEMLSMGSSNASTFSPDRGLGQEHRVEHFPALGRGRSPRFRNQGSNHPN